MDDVVEVSEYLFITFKFGGYWAQIKNKGRRKYEGGKQKTVKFQKNGFCFDVLKSEIIMICPWLKDHDFELFYHICGTSPKDYIFIKSEIEVMEMIAQCNGTSRVEVVILTKELRESNICVKDQQLIDGCQLECYDSSSEYFQDDMPQLNISQDLIVGARFSDILSFKQMLRTNAIVNNYGVKIQASNKSRVIAICSHRGCPWRVRAALCKDGQSFEVRKLEPTHLCPGENRAGNRQATSSWVAQQIEEIVRKNPDISPKQINNSLENMYGLSLPYMKVWRSREEARNSIFGSVDENYKWIPAFQAELVRRNPGSLITYTCDNHDGSFMRFFVSFKVCVDGFKSGCRPLIGLDACHLKSKYLGMLLYATSLDGNNGLYTIAFAIAESKSKKTWKWFLENLASCIGLDMNHLAFISDMEKGLADSVKSIFPDAEHKVCLRHMWKNLKKNYCRHDSQKIGSLVWSAANASYKLDYDEKMFELLKVSPQVHAYLLNLPYKWARSDFSMDIKNHYNTNNMAESFNSWIGEARTKPVVDLIDMIRGKLMEQRAERKLISSNWRGNLVPYAEDYIRDLTTRKDNFIIRQSTCSRAEVEGRHDRHEVDLENRECSCRLWQLIGLPCIHAAAFIGTKEHPLWHIYVDEMYYVSRYQMTYAGPISTLLGKGQWSSNEIDIQVGVPNTLRPRGRPKKRRIKNFLEGPRKKA